MEYIGTLNVSVANSWYIQRQRPDDHIGNKWTINARDFFCHFANGRCMVGWGWKGGGVVESEYNMLPWCSRRRFPPLHYKYSERKSLLKKIHKIRCNFYDTSDFTEIGIPFTKHRHLQTQSQSLELPHPSFCSLNE